MAVGGVLSATTCGVEDDGLPSRVDGRSSKLRRSEAASLKSAVIRFLAAGKAECMSRNGSDQERRRNDGMTAIRSDNAMTATWCAAAPGIRQFLGVALTSKDVRRTANCELRTGCTCAHVHMVPVAAVVAWGAVIGGAPHL